MKCYNHFNSQEMSMCWQPKNLFLSHIPTGVRLQVLILGAKTKTNKGQPSYMRKEDLFPAIKDLRLQLRMQYKEPGIT